MTFLNRLGIASMMALVLVLAGCPSSNGPGGAVIPLEDTTASDGAGGEDTFIPTQCQDDGDCEAGHCDPFTGTCVDCVNDSHCGQGFLCDKWTCVPAQECQEDGDCPADKVCDPDKNVCVPCLTDAHCEAGEVCIDQVCLISCLDGSPCPPGSICDPEWNACVECLADEDCAEPQWCHLGEKLCYPDVCDPGEFICDGNAVLQCVDNGSGWGQPMPCPQGTACIGGVCEEGLICVPDLVTCKDEKTLAECNFDGTILTEVPCPQGTVCDNGVCTEECVPSCDGKECGASGCPGYSCGDCPEGFQCKNFKCIPGGCVPDCEGKECGPDKCGGVCGACADFEKCTPSGVCLAQECFPGEVICDGDTVLHCAPDGTWHEEPCPPGTSCDDGECVAACMPNCDNKDCGPDGCGDSCGSCPAGASCNPGGICVNTCQPECPADVECGSNGCGGLCGVCDNDEACVDGQCKTSLTCVEMQQCSWQCGGNEGCQQSCWADASVDAQLQWMDIMQCINATCGQNPSNQCWQSAVGNGGACQDAWNTCQECTPECEGLQCGDDGCGSSCGTCPSGYACDNHGYCLCAPQCDGKECGPDGCGGQCGFCNGGDVCNYQGDCVCMPDCEGKECGSNGCGGQCGTCPPGLSCSPDGICDGEVCPDGQVLDCSGNCAPEDWIGDGYCDMEESEFGANFYCEQYDWDAGDCDGDNCGNQYCQEYLGENCENCPEDCGPCGGCQDGYVEDCEGQCRPDHLLGNGHCNDGNGGGPGGGANFNCQQWDWDMGDCDPEPWDCGDGFCDPDMGESCETCPWDCGECSEGDCCSAHDGPGCEDPEISACVCQFDPFCCQEYWDDLCVDMAVNECGAWWCEPDWCDEICQQFECGEFEDCWCGDCPEGMYCQDGQCMGDEPICELLCQMTECGVVGPCNCGSCGWGEECVNNQCVNPWECEETCWDKECGLWNGCDCGTCPAGEICGDNGTCYGSEPGMTCQELVNCAISCGFTSDCIFQCYGEGSTTGQAQFQNLALCVLQSCGGMNVDCAMDAIYGGVCEDQFKACM